MKVQDWRWHFADDRLLMRYAYYKGRGFGGEAELNSADYNNHLGNLLWLQEMVKSRLTVG